jgi:hypothetical protein
MVKLLDQDIVPTLRLTRKKGLAGTGNLMAGDRLHPEPPSCLIVILLISIFYRTFLRIDRKILLVSQELDSWAVVVYLSWNSN